MEKKSLKIPSLSTDASSRQERSSIFPLPYGRVQAAEWGSDAELARETAARGAELTREMRGASTHTGGEVGLGRAAVRRSSPGRR